MSDERFVDAPPAGAEGWREVWQRRPPLSPAAVALEFLLRFLRRLFRRVGGAGRASGRRTSTSRCSISVADLRRDIGRVARRSARATSRPCSATSRSADEALAAEIAQDPRADPGRGEAQRRADRGARSEDRDGGGARARRDESRSQHRKRPRTISSTAGSRTGCAAAKRSRSVARLRRPRARSPAAARRRLRARRVSRSPAARPASLRAASTRTSARSPICGARLRRDAGRRAGVLRRASRTARSARSWRMHVVEHLPVDALFALFREAARVLRAGGLLIIETPNAESLAVSALRVLARSDASRAAPSRRADAARPRARLRHRRDSRHPSVPRGQRLRGRERRDARAGRCAQRAALRRPGSAVGAAARVRGCSPQSTEVHDEHRLVFSAPLWSTRLSCYATAGRTSPHRSRSRSAVAAGRGAGSNPRISPAIRPPMCATLSMNGSDSRWRC